MKKISTIVFLLVFNFYCVAQNTEENKSDYFFAKMEVIQPLLFSGIGYTIEPELLWQHEKVCYRLIGGYSKISPEEIYKELDYENTGRYLQFGLQFRLNAFKKKAIYEGLFMGLLLNVSDFKEKGSLVFEGDYFEDYTPTLAQSNTLVSLGYNTSIRLIMSGNWMIDFGAEIWRILSEYDQPHFPVYYVPGNGVTNIFEDVEDNYKITMAISVKLGYKF